MTDQKEPSPEKPVLTFEEFIAKVKSRPRYDNFFLHFSGGLGGSASRNAEHYKRFEREHHDKILSLCDKIQGRDTGSGVFESLRPFEQELYDAYTIMRSYGVSDEELFR